MPDNTWAELVADLPVLHLSMESIGDILVRHIAVSVMLGHAEPRNTLCYVHPEPGTEGDLVNDVLGGMSNAELTAKWFGGMEGAQRLAGRLSADAFGDMISKTFANAPKPEYPKWGSPEAEDRHMRELLPRAWRKLMQDPDAKPYEVDVVRREAKKRGIELPAA